MFSTWKFTLRTGLKSESIGMKPIYLALSSQVNALWQLYVTYGLIFGMGEGAGFTTTTSTTARWFLKRRGLALGMVASGAGIGTLIIPPVAHGGCLRPHRR